MYIYRSSKKLRNLHPLHYFNNPLYLNLLSYNLYRILDRVNNYTNIRKLKKIELLKVSELRLYCLNFNLIIHLVISKMKPQILSKSMGMEHPYVKRVIEIAEEMMNKNRILNVENLYNVAKKRLNLSRNGLLRILQFLIDNKILIDGSKFSRKMVLSNPIRRGIYNFIKKNPGVHFSYLRSKALSIESNSSGQLIWHLEMLLKFNYIHKIKVGNYSVFLPIEIDAKLGIIYFLIRDRINRKIVDMILIQNSIKKSEIFKLIDEKRELVNYRINNLIDFNVICSEDEKNNEVYLNPNKREDIFNILSNIKTNFNKS